ncbi:hypothetical protein BV898_06917 [Hypsibius exemplaris]|uniref:Uncharacterized protein n=1 Tax=Hypsibius exemplaris TaxID=2072580 RepID=A0A1W0WV43_HYPEX|nr:hypothetical protein BV898_06917 [Hypsibius exemplaris]
MASQQVSSLSMCIFLASVACVIGAPLAGETKTSNVSTVSLPSNANATATIRPLSAEEINKTVSKHKAEQSLKSSEWQQNAAGKWEWKGKATTKKVENVIAVASTVKADFRATPKAADVSSSEAPKVAINSSASNKEIKEIKLTQQAVTVAAASGTSSGSTAAPSSGSTAAPSSSSTADSSSSTKASSTPAVVVPQHVIQTVQNKTEKIAPLPDVLEPLSLNELELIGERAGNISSGASQNSSSEAKTSTVSSTLAASSSSSSTIAPSSSSSSTSAPESSSSSTQVPNSSSSSSLAPSSSSSSTAVPVSSSSSSLAPSSSSSSTTQSTTAKLLDSSSSSSISPSFFPSTANPAEIKLSEQNASKPANNQSLPSGSTVYNSLSELAASGLKVGEKLEVSSVDSKTNTIVLSVKAATDNSSADEAKSPEKKVEVEELKTTPAAVVVAAENKPESRPAKPSIAIPALPSLHWSGAASDIKLPEHRGPVPEPGSAPSDSKIVKMEKAQAAEKKADKHEHWSGAASELNAQQTFGPAPEPHADRHKGDAKAPPKSALDVPKHWSGSASELGMSQFAGPKEAGPDVVGKAAQRARGKTPAPQPAVVAIPASFDKIPYMWDSLMQGVLGIISPASNFVASTFGSDGSDTSSSGGIFSMLPTFDFASIQQNAKISGDKVANANNPRRSHRQ